MWAIWGRGDRGDGETGRMPEMSIWFFGVKNKSPITINKVLFFL
jgi:hypothetical protein